MKRDECEHAAGEPEEDDGLRRVREVREIGQSEIGAVDDDLFDFQAGHPAQGVEVVDEAVLEDPAAGGEELAGGGRLVERAHVDAAQVADLPFGQPLARRGVGGVETTLEADVDGDVRFLRGGVRAPGGFDVEGHGLLAEDRHSQPSGFAEEAGVRVGRSGEDESVQILGGEHALGGAHFGTVQLRDSPGAPGGWVGHHQLARLLREDARVHGPDASRPEEAYRLP